MFVVNFRKYGFTQEETFSVCIRNAEWLEQEISLHIKVLPNRMKQITKWYELPVKVVVENWRLKTEAKGESAENKKIFKNCWLSSTNSCH
jgi:hypothetical protein